MKSKTFVDQIGTVTYDESLFLGRKKLYVDDVLCEKVGKKQYVYTDKDGKTTNLSLKGNYISGVTVSDGINIYSIIDKPKWYEYLFFAVIVLFHIIWGNSIALVQILPLVGGAIGGLIGAVFAVLALCIMRLLKSVGLKVLIGFVFLGASILFNYCVCIVILSALLIVM